MSWFACTVSLSWDVYNALISLFVVPKLPSPLVVHSKPVVFVVSPVNETPPNNDSVTTSAHTEVSLPRVAVGSPQEAAIYKRLTEAVRAVEINGEK